MYTNGLKIAGLASLIAFGAIYGALQDRQPQAKDRLVLEQDAVQGDWI